MSTVVISGPSPIVTPSDLTGSYEDDNLAALSAIAAVQGRIDGPTGWVGRSFGVQVLDTLMAVQSNTWQRIPYPPVIEVLSVTDEGGNAVSFERDPVELDRIKFSSSTGSVRVRYRAGYEWDEEKEKGTGVVPAQAKHAVIVGADRLMTLNVADMALKTETVEGVGSDTYTVSADAEAMIDGVITNLLSGLRIVTP